MKAPNIAELRKRCEAYRTYQEDDTHIEADPAFDFADGACNEWLPECLAVIERLQGALPKTADGVTAIPGETIYVKGSGIAVTVPSYSVTGDGVPDDRMVAYPFAISDCYSAREAAEAAAAALAGQSREIESGEDSS